MKAVDFTGEAVRLLDQSALPHEEVWLELKTAEEIADAIREMKVRGAPAIGVAAAFGVAISKNPEEAGELLKASRPTAIDLSHAVDYVQTMLRNGRNGIQAAYKWKKMNEERRE